MDTADRPRLPARLPRPARGAPRRPTGGGVLDGHQPRQPELAVCGTAGPRTTTKSACGPLGAGKSLLSQVRRLRNSLPGGHGCSRRTPRTSTARSPNAVGGSILRLGAHGVKTQPARGLPAAIQARTPWTRRASLLHPDHRPLQVTRWKPDERVAMDRAILAHLPQAGITHRYPPPAAPARANSHATVRRPAAARDGARRSAHAVGERQV